MKIFSAGKGLINHIVCSFLMFRAPVELFTGAGSQIIEAIHIENRAQTFFQKEAAMINYVIGKNCPSMRGTDSCQTGHSFGHSFVNDHIPGVEAAHAVSNDVNLFGSRSCDDLIDSGLQLSLIHISEPTRLLSISY